MCDNLIISVTDTVSNLKKKTEIAMIQEALNVVEVFIIMPMSAHAF